MYKDNNFNHLYKYKILKYINIYDHQFIKTYNESQLIKKNINYSWINCTKLSIGYKIKNYLNNVTTIPILTINFIKNKRILNENIIITSMKFNIKKILFNVSNIHDDIIKLIFTFLFK